MKTAPKFLFTSERLGFRAWEESDLDAMAAICADERVMEFFPKPLSRADTKGFIEKMQEQQAAYGHCYFAVELLERDGLIGFVGLAYQTYEAPFTPGVDIGWRLAQSAWGHGYATEGAKRCLVFAKEELKLNKMYAVASKTNLNSINVMEKIGMRLELEFNHPALHADSGLNPCVLYKCSI